MPNRPCYWVKMNASSRKRAHTLYVKFQELMFDPLFFVCSTGSSVFLTCYFSKNRMSSMLVAQRFLFQSKLLFNYFDNKEFPALQFSFYVQYIVVQLIQKSAPDSHFACLAYCTVFEINIKVYLFFKSRLVYFYSVISCKTSLKNEIFFLLIIKIAGIIPVCNPVAKWMQNMYKLYGYSFHLNGSDLK